MSPTETCSSLASRCASTAHGTSQLPPHPVSPPPVPILPRHGTRYHRHLGPPSPLPTPPPFLARVWGYLGMSGGVWGWISARLSRRHAPEPVSRPPQPAQVHRPGPHVWSPSGTHRGRRHGGPPGRCGSGRCGGRPAAARSRRRDRRWRPRRQARRTPLDAGRPARLSFLGSLARRGPPRRHALGTARHEPSRPPHPGAPPGGLAAAGAQRRSPRRRHGRAGRRHRRALRHLPRRKVGRPLMHMHMHISHVTCTCTCTCLDARWAAACVPAAAACPPPAAPPPRRPHTSPPPACLPPCSPSADPHACHVARRSHVFLPCGHFCVCEACVSKAGGACPMCREPIVQTHRVFA